MHSRFRAVGLVTLSLTIGVLGILNFRNEPVQAAPVASPPIASSPSVPVGATFTVTASWTDDDGGLVLETTALLFALESVPSVGSIVATSCDSAADLTANSDGQSLTLTNGATLDICEVGTDLDQIPELTTIVITYQCLAPGTITFTLTEGLILGLSLTSPPTIVTCTPAAPTFTPTPTSTATPTTTPTATATGTAATATPTQTATPTPAAISSTAAATPVTLSLFMVPTRVPPNLGAFLNGANGTQENLARAATAQARQASARQSASAPGPVISPPSTGDAGLIPVSKPGPSLVLAGLVVIEALVAGRLADRGRR